MRESIGGAFLIKLMVVFLVLYNTLLAIAVNYAIAFRVKNQIINLLEQYEGCARLGERVSNYVADVGYYRVDGVNERGYDIMPRDDASRGTYYQVTTYIKFDFPFMSYTTRIPIKGETKVIYGVHETDESGVCSGI
ncbi:MAG: hypothetical protein PHQ89_02625 [Bacilli bacterium]|nr:hypothetical protein [Bacilli bacterium]